MSKIRNICANERYVKDGVETSSWNKIGIIIDKGDKCYVKLFAHPNALFQVFDQKEKEEKGGIDL